MTLALIFALAPVASIAVVFLYYLGSLAMRLKRARWPRDLWYPSSGGDVIEVRKKLTFATVNSIANDPDACDYRNMHETAFEAGSRYMVIGLDLERADGPLFMPRKVGRVALMGTGETTGMKTLEWFENSPLANGGFQKYFRRIVIQDKYKRKSAERAEQLLEANEEEEAQEN